MYKDNRPTLLHTSVFWGSSQLQSLSLTFKTKKRQPSYRKSGNMKITKLDGHKGQGKVSILEKKNFGKSGQKLPKRRYQWFIVQLQIFCPGLFCPALSGKTNFPTTCPSVIQTAIFWHFSELQSLFTKISIKQTEVQHEAWNLC